MDILKEIEEAFSDYVIKVTKIRRIYAIDILNCDKQLKIKIEKNPRIKYPYTGLANLRINKNYRSVTNNATEDDALWDAVSGFFMDWNQNDANKNLIEEVFDW